MNNEEMGFLGLRYLLLIILGLTGIFYIVFTPLTVYPVFLVLKAFYHQAALVFVDYPIIVIGDNGIKLIEACIAGSAYFLLAILNLATPMQIKKRLQSLLFLFGSFLVLNIIRIIIFSTLSVTGFTYFDIAHLLTWYVGSTIIVVAIWFANVKIFSLEAIPAYTDIMSIVHDISPAKKATRIRHVRAVKKIKARARRK